VPEAPAVQVKVQVIQLVPVEDKSEYVATLRSRDSAIVMPEVEGRITEIYAHSGDRVTAGTPLMQIDPAKQQATVKREVDTHAAQRADLDFKKKQYERTQALFEAGVVAKQDLDQAKSAYENSESTLQALDSEVAEQRVQLHYYKVVAPLTGTVGDIPVRVGDRVKTDTALTTVDRGGPLEVYVYIPLERVPYLKLDLPVQVVDVSEKVLADCRISFISPEVDTTTQTVLAKANVANRKDVLRQYQYIRARVIWGTHPAQLVPLLSVTRIGGQYFVFVVEDDKGKAVARQRPLKVGEMVDNDYIVLDGLKPGDKIIVSGTQSVVDGTPVTPETS
jgi:RND family efflux transporter MFP subunit